MLDDGFTDMEGKMFFKEEFNKKTIIQLRWALIISLGYIILFSHHGNSPIILLNVFLPAPDV